MSKSKQISDAIIAQGMLPLYFNASEEVSLDTLKAIYKAGVKALEYTNRGDAALVILKRWLHCAMQKCPAFY